MKTGYSLQHENELISGTENITFFLCTSLFEVHEIQLFRFLAKTTETVHPSPLAAKSSKKLRSEEVKPSWAINTYAATRVKWGDHSGLSVVDRGRGELMDIAEALRDCHEIPRCETRLSRCLVLVRGLRVF
jgi:hypothetical protein